MKKTKGFTLVEMIVVVSIICIIVSIVVPVTIGQLRKSTDRKYVVEGKVLESAVEIYNTEILTNQIKIEESLYSIKEKLLNGSKRYINSWPDKLKGSFNGNEVEIGLSDLNNYKLENILNYINEKEKNIY